tara:strand:+ start:215 stop:883 length:669 start_codon:yes stop_codon:yes gene_type:complete
MASKLTKWINAHLKAKGKSPKEAQKDAGKYSSIAAAKRAGSLYYTDKKGRVMIAAYAEDLAKPLPKPKKRPEVVKPKKRPEVAKPKKTETVSNKEVEKAISKAKLKIRIAESEASVRSALAAVEEADRKLDIFNKTNVLNERAREFKKTKVASKKYLKRVEKEAKEKGKGPEVTIVTVAKNMRRKTDTNPRRGYESGRDDLQSLPRYLQNIRTNPSARRKKK